MHNRVIREVLLNTDVPYSGITELVEVTRTYRAHFTFLPLATVPTNDTIGAQVRYTCILKFCEYLAPVRD